MSMKSISPSLRPWLILLVVILLAASSAAIRPSSPLQYGLLPTAVLAAPTPTPELPVDEVSMDLIVLLGGLLLLIVLAPILLSLRPGLKQGKETGAQEKGGREKDQ